MVAFCIACGHPSPPAERGPAPVVLDTACEMACCSDPGETECCMCQAEVYAPRQSFTTSGAPHRIHLELRAPRDALIQVESIELLDDAGGSIAIPWQRREYRVHGAFDVELGAGLPVRRAYHFRLVVATEVGKATIDAFVDFAYRDPIRG